MNRLPSKLRAQKSSGARTTRKQPLPLCTRSAPQIAVDSIIDGKALAHLQLLIRRDPVFRRLWNGDRSQFAKDIDADVALCLRLLNVARGDVALAFELLRASSRLGRRCAKKITGDAEAYWQIVLRRATVKRAQLLGLDQSTKVNGDQIATGRLTVRFDQVRSAPVPELWAGRVPLGEVTALIGEPGKNKSGLAVAIAARVTKGAPWPDGADNVAGDVLFVTSEDSWTTTLRPRLEVAGGRMRRAHWFQEPNVLELGHGTGQLEETLRRLEQGVHEIGGCRLIIVDPITAIPGVDSNSENKVRRLLTGLKQIAERNRLAVIVILHTNKRTGGTAGNRALGSIAFTAVPRAVYFVGAAPDNANDRVLASYKYSLGPPPASVRFRLFPSKRYEKIGIVQFTDWGVQITADDLLRGSTGSAPAVASSYEIAANFLRQLLAAGRLRQTQIQQAATAAGIALSTLRRVKKQLGIRSFRPPSDRESWWWELASAPCSTSSSSASSGRASNRPRRERSPPDNPCSGEQSRM